MITPEQWKELTDEQSDRLCWLLIDRKKDKTKPLGAFHEAISLEDFNRFKTTNKL